MSTSNADLLRELRIDRRDEPPPPRRWVKWLLLALAAIALLAVAGLFLGKPRPVEAATAEVGTMDGAGSGSVLDATGYVVARRMATVSAKVPGKVREVRIEEGQQVREGEIIAMLDPIDAAQQRDLAASQLSAAQSAVAGIDAQLREAEANATRLGRLVRDKLVSRAQYDQALAQRDALRAQRATAQRNVAVARDGLRIAAQGVDNTVVRAPFDGIVIAKAAQPGEIVSPMAAGGGFTRTGIGTIVDMDSLEVEVDVGESYIGRVQPGMPVEAMLNAYPDWKIPGSVIAIIPTADRAKATVKVRIKLNVEDPRIVPDMGVRVSFMEPPQAGGQPARTGVRVPAGAIVQRDGQDGVFVVGDDGLATFTAVTPGDALGEDERQVTAGLQAGATVVLDPPDSMKTGTPVKASGDGGQ